jgi:hypothetical protein
MIVLALKGVYFLAICLSTPIEPFIDRAWRRLTFLRLFIHLPVRNQKGLPSFLRMTMERPVKILASPA